jgi:hypothetical protein
MNSLKAILSRITPEWRTRLKRIAILATAFGAFFLGRFEAQMENAIRKGSAIARWNVTIRQLEEKLRKYEEREKSDATPGTNTETTPTGR